MAFKNIFEIERILLALSNYINYNKSALPYQQLCALFTTQGYLKLYMLSYMLIYVHLTSWVWRQQQHTQ